MDMSRLIGAVVHLDALLGDEKTPATLLEVEGELVALPEEICKALARESGVNATPSHLVGITSEPHVEHMRLNERGAHIVMTLFSK